MANKMIPKICGGSMIPVGGECACATYDLSKDGDTITLTGSDGSTSNVTDDNTTYDLSIDDHTLTLTGSDGSTSSAVIPGGGGGGDIFKVTFTDVGAAQPEYVADKTFDEVVAAVNSGKFVVGFEDYFKGFYTLVHLTNYGAHFTCISDVGPEHFDVSGLYWNKESGIEYYYHSVGAN